MMATYMTGLRENSGATTRAMDLTAASRCSSTGSDRQIKVAWGGRYFGYEIATLLWQNRQYSSDLSNVENFREGKAA